jgi:hypothetical protein
VGEGVPEQVGVQVLDAGLPAAAAEELGDAGGGHPAFAADPEPLGGLKERSGNPRSTRGPGLKARSGSAFLSRRGMLRVAP